MKPGELKLVYNVKSSSLYDHVKAGQIKLYNVKPWELQLYNVKSGELKLNNLMLGEIML